MGSCERAVMALESQAVCGGGHVLISKYSTVSNIKHICYF